MAIIDPATDYIESSNRAQARISSSGESHVAPSKPQHLIGVGAFRVIDERRKLAAEDTDGEEVW